MRFAVTHMNKCMRSYILLGSFFMFSRVLNNACFGGGGGGAIEM